MRSSFKNEGEPDINLWPPHTCICTYARMHTYAHIRWFLKSSHVLHKLKWVRDVACVTGKLHTQSKREKLQLSGIENRIAYLSEEMVRKRPLKTKIQQMEAKKSLAPRGKTLGGRTAREKSPGAIHLWIDLRKREDTCGRWIWSVMSYRHCSRLRKLIRNQRRESEQKSEQLWLRRSSSAFKTASLSKGWSHFL